MTSDPSVFFNAVKIAQAFISADAAGGPVTPSQIATKVELVFSMAPDWAQKVEKSLVVEELIRRFSIWVGGTKTIVDLTGHKQWLNRPRKENWRYWRRYQEYLEKSLPVTAVDSIDQSTDEILGLLEDPTRTDPWDRRGLVVGHVQSGKTGNYTGLICKAADAGYKIIIVLAGIHNSLRSQTQMRLDEGFLGYETNPDSALKKTIGVGLIDSDMGVRPDFATTRTEKGDFNKRVADALGITPAARPTLFVVKKNKSVLQGLLRWIENRLADGVDHSTGRRIVESLPILVIDDEADHASVDTGANVLDEDGQVDLDHQPTAINSLIRKILHTFSHVAYVGYTATPFANIFIHEKAKTIDEGPDLFPAAFIQTLAAPSNYVGPHLVFGKSPDLIGDEEIGMLKSISSRSDLESISQWMPPNHKSTHIPRLAHSPFDLPRSLSSAIDTFLVLGAIKGLRGTKEKHCSMLIHVTRFTSVQGHVAEQVRYYVDGLRQKLVRGIDVVELEERLLEIWTVDIQPTSRKFLAAGRADGGEIDFSWGTIYEAIKDFIAEVKIRKINGTAKDVLDYKENEETGLKIIAIGGDKLSRGLTLEGLCVSYFLRASRMYDTLMQMGRWFGYRGGYADLCRLYTTADLVGWFAHITEAASELREEFDTMSASGASPREFGLKVQSHPVLLVTSPIKMRAARELQVSYSGCILETTTFLVDRNDQKQNFDILKQLAGRLGSPKEGPEIRRERPTTKQKWEGYLWNNVASADVLDFLSAFRTSPDARKMNCKLISDFVERMNKLGELTNWTVAILGGGEGGIVPVSDGIRVSAIQRAQKRQFGTGFSIGRLLSPRDESIDVSDNVWSAALEDTIETWKADPNPEKAKTQPDAPGGASIRKVLGPNEHHNMADPTRALLLVYLVDPIDQAMLDDLGVPGIVGIGLSLPRSNSIARGTYLINNVEWENEYGPAD